MQSALIHYALESRHVPFNRSLKLKIFLPHDGTENIFHYYQYLTFTD
ncbi:hypothetical protein DmGdi_17520 [Gluconobacter sp. Gdi]|nr:hypothetical protein DmGdi_17520 [Gluconobacter sp. Gdi]